MGGAVSLSPTGPRMLAAGAALVLVALVSCSSGRGPSQVTRIEFDGETYTINGQVSCVSQTDGTLVINAPTSRSPFAEGGRQLIRVVLAQEHPPVVQAAGFRFRDVYGFSDDSGAMSAIKDDNTYEISGRMPPNDGETGSHQFKIVVICSEIVPAKPLRPDYPRIPRPRLPRY
jgi:Mycobacterium 19 kDa lipoprotein antigen